MNEVSSLRGTQQPPVSASSKATPTEKVDAVKVDTTAAGSSGQVAGKTLPAGRESAELSSKLRSENADKPNVAEENDTAKEVEDAVASMNSFVQSVQRDLLFTVDNDLDRTVVKVVDTESGDVIRQIPEETFLELARNMKERGELHLVDATG